MLRKIVVAVLFLLILSGKVMEYVTRDEFPDEGVPGVSDRIYLASTLVYMGLEGNSAFCKQYGYEVVHYPQEFSKMFAPEIKLVNQEIEKAGYTVDEYYRLLGKKIRRPILATKQRNFEPARRGEILRMVAEEEGIPFETVVWEPEYDELYTMKELCEDTDISGPGDGGAEDPLREVLAGPDDLDFE